MVLQPLLEEEVLSLEPFKFQSLHKPLLAGHYVEGVCVGCAGGLKELNHEGEAKLVLS